MVDGDVDDQEGPTWMEERVCVRNREECHIREKERERERERAYGRANVSVYICVCEFA